jgi:VWFA-related protein
MKRGLIAAGLAIASAGAAAAPQQQQPVFRTAIDSVTVDVSVRQRGRPITDLTAADFELRDNGIVQQVADVGRESLPIDVTLVVDMSGSVEGPLLISLTRAITAIGGRLQPGDRASVVTFSDHVLKATPLASVDGASLGGALGTPRGQTSLGDAIVAALIAPAEPDRRHMAIVFTDGRDIRSFLDDAAVLDVAQRSGTTVFAVAVTDGTVRVKQPAPNAHFFEALTANTGGALAVLQRDQDLGESFVRALEDFRTSYVLRYVVNGTPPGGWHDLAVKVTRPGSYEVRARKGYFGAATPGG